MFLKLVLLLVASFNLILHCNANRGTISNLSVRICRDLLTDANTSDVTISCSEAEYVKSFLSQIEINILRDETLICNNFLKTSTSLVIDKKKYNNIRYLWYHNTLDSIIALMLYWERFEGSFLIDDSSGIDYKTGFDYLNEQLRTAEVFYVNSVGDIDNFLRNIQFTFINIVTICSEEMTNAIVHKAKQLDLFSTNHTWVISGLNLPTHLIGIDITPDSQVTLILPQLNEIMSSPILEQEIKSDENIARNIELWLPECSRLRPGRKIQLLLHSTDKYMSMLASVPDIGIFDVFFSLETNKTEQIKFANWDVIKGLFMLENFDKHDQNERLRGRRIRTVVFQHPPYTMLRTINGKFIVTGYGKEMFDMIMDTLNIRYSIKEVEEVFGIGVNGTFTGFVGILFRREAEMAINALAMTNSRRAGLRYVGSVFKASLAIMSNKPETVIPPTTYLMPFNMKVWFVTMAAFGLIILLLAIGNLWYPRIGKILSTAQLYHSPAFRMVTFTFLEEVFVYPVGPSAKVFYGTLLLAAVAIFAHYTSIFTSFLAHRDETLLFRNLDDVAANYKYTILVVRNTRHHDILQYAKTGVYVKVWKRIVGQGEKSFVKNFEVGVQKTYTGNYAFLSDGPTLMFLSSENCSVSFAPTVYTKEHWCMAHRRDFPYTRLFTRLLMQIMEGGIINRLAIVYKANKQQRCSNDNLNASFGFSQVVGVFFIWNIGVVLAVICMCFERQIYKFKRRPIVKKEIKIIFN